MEAKRQDYSSIDAYEKVLNDNLIKNLDLLTLGKLPDKYIDGPLLQLLKNPIYDEYGNVVWLRNKYIEKVGFPLYAENWVKPLAKWIGVRPCLEIMGGSGYFSYALHLYGCKIICTDNFSWRNRIKKFYYNIENLDCVEAIEKYGKDVKFIICSWPYMDFTAYYSLMKMREVNSNCRMIYVGEDIGGCTANNQFFNNIEECDIKGFKEAVKNYRTWQGLHDRVWLIK